MTLAITIHPYTTMRRQLISIRLAQACTLNTSTWLVACTLQDKTIILPWYLRGFLENRPLL